MHGCGGAQGVVAADPSNVPAFRTRSTHALNNASGGQQHACLGGGSGGGGGEGGATVSAAAARQAPLLSPDSCWITLLATRERLVCGTAERAHCEAGIGVLTPIPYDIPQSLLCSVARGSIYIVLARGCPWCCFGEGRAWFLSPACVERAEDAMPITAPSCLFCLFCFLN